MADKLPVKAIFTGPDVTALGEFEPTDTIALALISGFAAGVTTELGNNSLGALGDVSIPAPANNEVLTYNSTSGNWEAGLSPGSSAAIWGNITGTLSNQTDLQLALDGKSNTGHTHVEADITDLQAYLLGITGESIKDLSDVFTTMTPVDGQVLTYDTTNGWQAETVAAIPTPGGVNSNIQYNNGGVFGGNAAFSFDDVALEVNILGNGGDTQLTVGGTVKPDAAETASTLYVEVQAVGSDIDGIYTYFNRSTPGSNGWIANAYDGATPYIRLVDEDDDSPYIKFSTIGAGSDAVPDFDNRFGARADPAGSNGNITTGFQWIANGTDAMLLDTNFLTLPRDTTANRPVVPANGMIRYNTTSGKFEGYESGAWTDIVHAPKSHLSRHNGGVTQTFSGLTTILFGTNIREDLDYTYNAGEITINRAGWYKLEYALSIDNGNNQRTTSRARMELNTTQIDGTVGHGYHRNASNGETTLVGITKQNLAVNDVIRVRVSGTSAIDTVANGCSINIESID